MKIADVTSKQVIHCPTKEEREKILKLAEDAGRKFWSDSGRIKFLDCEYGDRTCINVRGTYMTYSPVEFYRNEGYDILEAKLFLDNTTIGWFFGFANKAGIWGYCGNNKRPNDKPIIKTIDMVGGGGCKGWWCYIGPLLEAPAYVPTYTEWDIKSNIVPDELYVGNNKIKIRVHHKLSYPDGSYGIRSYDNSFYSSGMNTFYTLD